MFYVGQLVYYKLNINYIIETYCINKEKPELKCNGKCHIAKQLTAISKTKKNDEAVFNVTNSFYLVLYHFVYEDDMLIKETLFEENKKLIFSYHKSYFLTLINKHFKPPTIV